MISSNNQLIICLTKSRDATIYVNAEPCDIYVKIVSIPQQSLGLYDCWLLKGA
jgi:hypothetical protein